AARLPRADRLREPRPVRTALPGAGAARANRHAARALSPLGRPPRARRQLLARDGATTRALPDAPPRAPSPAARRAVRRAGRSRDEPARRGARRARHRADARRRHARAGASRGGHSEREAGAVTAYASDVAALTR